MKTIWVLHGPNLNLLGSREPEIYGRSTLAEIDAQLIAHGRRHGVTVECFQSNREGALVDRVQAARGVVNGLVINAAAYSHTSIALRDALVFAEVPAIEVHLSNVARREDFRHRSLLADVCRGTITGLGPVGYQLALDALVSDGVHEVCS